VYFPSASTPFTLPVPKPVNASHTLSDWSPKPQQAPQSLKLSKSSIFMSLVYLVQPSYPKVISYFLSPLHCCSNLIFRSQTAAIQGLDQSQKRQKTGSKNLPQPSRTNLQGCGMRCSTQTPSTQQNVHSCHGYGWKG
jgi:hypothetical protein